MNTKAFAAVKRLILRAPKRVNMNEGVNTNPNDVRPSCGTVGCIAGWASIVQHMEASGLSLLAATIREERRNFSTSWHSGVMPSAIEYLDIPESHGHVLFYPGRWPENLADALYATEAGTREYAMVVAQAIDRYVSDPEGFYALSHPRNSPFRGNC